MTPEQLEAHRVRFEQRYAADRGWVVKTVSNYRHSTGYGHSYLHQAWQAYQWAIADADRAQRAAPGVQDGTSGESRNEGDCCDCGGDCPRFCCQVYMSGFGSKVGLGNPDHPAARPPQQSAQPVEAANGLEKGLDIRMSQGWNLKGGICPVLYSDTVNGYGVGRDDLWLATTDALKSAQPVEVQRRPLTADEVWINNDLMALNAELGLTLDQFIELVRAVEAAHGIKPTMIRARTPNMRTPDAHKEDDHGQSST